MIRRTSFTLLIIVANLLAYATGDQNLTIGSCSNHPTGGRAIIYFSPNIPLIANPGQEISIPVILKLGPTTNRLAGIMLVTGTGNLPSQDGWLILEDPNRNPTPYNYNEKSNLPDSIEFRWRLRAPFLIGSYRLRAKLFYGDNGAKSKEATPIDIAVLPAGITEGVVSFHTPEKLTIASITRHELRLTMPDLKSPGLLEIYDLNGKRILSHITSPTESEVVINLEAQSPGVYFVRFSSHKLWVVQKFTKLN